jgi:hypothetical protein
MTHTGRCLCGAVRFRIDGALAPIQVCHCEQCRRAQGVAFAAVVPVATSAFHLEQGVDVLQAYASSPGKERVFCSRCGAPVFSRRVALPDVLRIRAGLIDPPLGVGVAWHAWTASRCDWWALPDDGAPRYEHAAPG